MKIKEKLIKLLGGITYNEYRDLYKKYNKLLNESSNDKTIQVCNETTFKNLTILEDYMRSLYGIPLEEWSDKIYNIIKNNRIRVLVYHLSDPKSHIIYKINIGLTDEEGSVAQ